MKTRRLFFASFFICALFPALAAEKPIPVNIPAGIDHSTWDVLLQKYVNEKGLVAYAKWKASAEDCAKLDAYLAQFAPMPGTKARGAEMAASAINAYNAFAIRWILQNYPTESIMALKDSFGRKAHRIGGVDVALNDLEHGTLRPAIGYKAHAALVCCARSCPPLQRSAYRAATLDEQIEGAYRTWLARPDLNRFDPAKKTAEVSSIFNWFKEDFAAAGGTAKILAKYAPGADQAYLENDDVKISYLSYRWGLNDQGKLGEKYGKTNLLFDAIF